MIPLAAKAITSVTIPQALVYSAIGFVTVLSILALIAIAIRAISALMSRADGSPHHEEHKAPPQAGTLPEPVLPNPAPLHPQEAEAMKQRILSNVLRLDGTNEKTAAVIMAVVAEKTGIPLERLLFHSIRRIREPLVLENVSESDAAVIMALVSHMSGIPLERLEFKSIKLSASTERV